MWLEKFEPMWEEIELFAAEKLGFSAGTCSKQLVGRAKLLLSLKRPSMKNCFNGQGLLLAGGGDVCWPRRLSGSFALPRLRPHESSPSQTFTLPDLHPREPSPSRSRSPPILIRSIRRKQQSLA